MMSGPMEGPGNRPGWYGAPDHQVPCARHNSKGGDHEEASVQGSGADAAGSSNAAAGSQPRGSAEVRALNEKYSRLYGWGTSDPNDFGTAGLPFSRAAGSDEAADRPGRGLPSFGGREERNQGANPVSIHGIHYGRAPNAGTGRPAQAVGE